MDIRDVMVVTLDRPRHEEGMKAIRDAGARVRLITDGDVAGVAARGADRSPVGLLWGIGGTPEGVISPAAIKCTGGGSSAASGRATRTSARPRSKGYDLEKQLTQDDLVKGDDCFFSATGVTDGDVLQGVRYLGRAATTESIVMRSRSGTVRRVSGRAQPREAARRSRASATAERRSPPRGRSSGSGSRGVAATSSKRRRRPTFDARGRGARASAGSPA